jgi:hypothetical protein
MKRALLLLVVLALLAAGAFFYLSRRGLTEGAQLVPADTVFYLAIPDLHRTVSRWPKTALAQIGAEPSVADFLKKPLSSLGSEGGLEGLNLLLRVDPSRFFLAVTAVRETGGDLVCGFQYSGGKKELDVAMERLYRELGKSSPASKRSTADYNGDTITSFSGGTPVLFSGSHGSWGFLSNSEAALKDSLDRVTGRSKAPDLASTADFEAVAHHLSKEPDFAWYGKLKPAVDVLLAIGKNQQPARVNYKQLAQLEKIKALGGTLRFDGADQKETTFVLYPGSPKMEAIDRSVMEITTPATTFFYECTMDWKTVATDDYFQTLPPAAQEFFTNAKIDLKQLPQTFGNDFGLAITWPEGAMIPSVLAAMQVKDRQRVEALVDAALVSFPVQTTGSELHGARVMGFPAAKIQLIDPAIASLTGAELERALTLQPSAGTLETAAAFKPAMSAYRESVQAFGYVDSKAMFERIYNQVRPIAIFAGAMSSDLSKVVDVQKLPETEAVSRHLTPIVYTNKQFADGWLIESTGPITLSQAFFLTMGGAVATYLSQAAAGAE